ncbi:PhoP regulatory network protein YrbL [compost metagenome]
MADLAKKGLLDDTLKARLDEFFDDLADAHVVVHDMSASNIAVGLNADGKQGLYLIDGFGVLPLIPLYAWSKRLNRRRIQRKYAHLRESLARRVREGSF